MSEKRKKLFQENSSEEIVVLKSNSPPKEFESPTIHPKSHKSQRIELSNLDISIKKSSPPINLPITINSRVIKSAHPPKKSHYERVFFSYNEEIELIPDFSNYNWACFNRDDFLTLLSHSKKTPMDFLRFYRNNHKDARFLRMSTSSDKILEMVYFDSDSGPINLIKFTGDRRILVTIGNDPVIKLWDSNDFHLIGTLEAHEESISCVFCCSRAAKILTACGDFSIRAWDIDSQRELLCLPRAHDDEITKISMNNLENLIFTASKDCCIKVIHAEKLTVLRVLDTHRRGVNDFCLSLDERFLISCANDQKIHVFDNKINELLYSQSHEIKAEHNSLQIVFFVNSFAREKLLTLMSNGAVVLWDFSLKCQEKVLVSHIYKVISLKLLSNSQIFCCSDNQMFLIFDVNSGCELVRKEIKQKVLCLDLYLRKDPENSFADRVQMVTGSHEGLINLWGIENISDFSRIFRHNSAISQLLITEDNRYIVFSSQNTVSLLDLTSNRVEKTLNSHTGPITCMRLLQGSKTLATGSADKTIKLWSLESAGQNSEETLNKHQAEVIALAFSADEELMVSVSSDQTLILWSFKERKEQASSKNIGAISLISFAENDESFFTAGSQGLIKQWTVQPFAETRSFVAHADAITELHVCRESSGNSLRLVSCGKDRWVKVWNLWEKGGPCFVEKQFFVAHGEIAALKLTNDGKNAVFCETPAKFHVYALDEDFEERLRELPAENLRDFAIFHNNKAIALGDAQGNVFVWEFNEPKFNEPLSLLEDLESFHGDREKIRENLANSQLWTRIFCRFLYPAKATLLHYLAYAGEFAKIQLLFELLQRNSKGKGLRLVFQRDLFGNTAIDVLFAGNDITAALFLVNQAINSPPGLHKFANATEIARKLAKIQYKRLDSLLLSRCIPLKSKEFADLRPISRVFQGIRAGFLPNAGFFSNEELVSKGLALRTQGNAAVYAISLEILDLPSFLDISEDESLIFFENVWRNERFEDSALQKREILQRIVDYKWKTYAKTLNFCSFCAYLFTWLLHLVYSVWLLPLRVRFVADFSEITAFALVNLVFLCVLSLIALLYFLANGYKLLCIGPKRYFSRFFPVFFLANLALFVIMLVFDWLGLFNVYFDEDLIRNLHAFDLFLWTFNGSAYLLPVENFDLMRLFAGIFQEIRGLCVISVVLIYNFGFISFILDKSWSFAYNFSDEKTVVYWKQPFESFDLVYRVMIRDFSAYNQETAPVYAIILWVFFLITSFLLIILVVNVFIAKVLLVSKRIRGENACFREKMDVCLDFDRMLPRKTREKMRNTGNLGKYMVFSRISEE